ncbi:MAG: GNAT family N-acetyltransferase [Candidatus Promineofilum sp.]|nr:GNAT family N-acetyltransferase [Promineifilum sp.]
MAIKIQLREVVAADLPIFFDNERDPVAVRMAAFTSKDPADRAAFDAHWARNLAAADGMIRTILVDGQVAGNVFSYVDAMGPEVSYWIGRDFWGRGIATSALLAFLEIQTARPLFARAAKDNLGSLRILEKCGFAITGQDRGFANGRGEEVEEYILELTA